MKINVLSDLHLEQSSPSFECKTPNESCDALVLAGDIGDPSSPEYAAFLGSASVAYPRVFVVCGNHECWGKTVDETLAAISAVCATFPNVVHLHRGQVIDLDEDDVRIIGATLWSDVSDEQRSDVGTFIADHRCIKQWGVEENNRTHRADAAFIQAEMEHAVRDGKHLVVVTHHAPSFVHTCKPEHAHSVLSSAFCTDLRHLLRDPVVGWIFGHTHHSSMVRFGGTGGTVLVSNQRGYHGETTGFRETCIVNISSPDTVA